jgi:tripartite-type tricarboxylate transporter receptor subunit TctC
MPRSLKRHEFFPEVATLKELGVDVAPSPWIGLFAPRATRLAEVIKRIGKVEVKP